MKLTRFAYLRGLGAAAVALAAVCSAGVAQARGDVYWNIGVEAAPGVTVGLGNARPVYVAPAPVYVAPAPVYVAPAPVYYARPTTVYYGAPVYYAPPRHHRHKHRHHHRHGRY